MGAQPFRDNALAAERTGVLEDRRTVATGSTRRHRPERTRRYQANRPIVTIRRSSVGAQQTKLNSEQSIPSAIS
jgi:hypothetical protein